MISIFARKHQIQDSNSNTPRATNCKHQRRYGRSYRIDTCSMIINDAMICLLWLTVVVCAILAPPTMGFVVTHHGMTTTTTTNFRGLERHSPGGPVTKMTRLFSLKPAAGPLMDSGKALARSGELLIDMTSGMDLYGGALSSVGALIRNSGDSVAQAAASCRFKTGLELVIDELRQGADSLTEAEGKLKLAVEEAQADKDPELASQIEGTVENMGFCGACLESAGAGLMQRKSLEEVGSKLVECGERLQVLSTQVILFAPKLQESKDCGQRMAFAAERMIEAGNQLKGTPKPKTTGKGWLKG